MAIVHAAITDDYRQSIRIHQVLALEQSMFRILPDFYVLGLMPENILGFLSEVRQMVQDEWRLISYGATCRMLCLVHPQDVDHTPEIAEELRRQLCACEKNRVQVCDTGLAE